MWLLKWIGVFFAAAIAFEFFKFYFVNSEFGLLDAPELKRSALNKVVEPKIKSLRCDTCRLIAFHFDTGFETAESRFSGDDETEELDEAEVIDIVDLVCSRRTFFGIAEIILEGQRRLLGPGLETLMLAQYNEDAEMSSDYEVNWPQRLKNHCRHLADKLGGLEVYEMWLRTSAGRPDGFEHFLCYGEGVFADCVHSMPDFEWPAGDEVSEDDDEVDEEGLETFMDVRTKVAEHAFIWDRQANAASKI